VNEPRGSDVLVGALLCKPHRADCQVGVIYFNNVGYLGMCGHGTIGLVASLAHAGKLGVGALKIDTPVGAVEARLLEDGQVEVANVPSYRKARRVAIDVPGVGKITGDVAWGGNWFFLAEGTAHHVTPDNLESLACEDCASGLPLLSDAIASLACRVVATYDAGDHTLFVAAIEEAVWRGLDEPLTSGDLEYVYVGRVVKRSEMLS